jgi:nicotinate-nucleotide adenylyltransferase
MIHGDRIGILGGTFDPVHVGHVDTARAAREALDLERVILMPSGTPPHRQYQPAASPEHRYAMTRLAAGEADGLDASDLELGVEGPSYTADTLARLHQSGIQPSQIFFITGADAFAEIHTWSRFPDVLDMAHFVAVSRPGHPATALPRLLPALAARMAAGNLTPLVASNLRIFLVQAETRDVSSTGIRRRLAAGESIQGMVPASVEAYIRDHGLYTRDTSTDGILDAAGRLQGTPGRHDES